MIGMHSRCVSIIASLWNVKKGENVVGTATAGSSEAIHFGGSAMEWHWQDRRKAEGEKVSNPNIITTANA